MEWPNVFVLMAGLVGGNAAIIIPLFYWNRSESNADRRHFDTETKELRRELIQVMRAIDAEMKDFHGRLCAIEERRGK